MKIGIIGHRPNKLGGEYDLTGPYSYHIRTELQQVIDDLHPTLMLSDMALGVDTIWAQLAVQNKIALMAVIPFPSQASIWTTESRQIYRSLLDYARRTGGIKTTGTDPYEAWKMEVKNKYMVNQCDLLVAVYNGDKSGGTYNCLTYAESVYKPILKIDPKPRSYENQGQGYKRDFVKKS